MNGKGDKIMSNYSRFAQDLTTYLEFARVALNVIPKTLGDATDLSDKEVARLAKELERYLNAQDTSLSQTLPKQ